MLMYLEKFYWKVTGGSLEESKEALAIAETDGQCQKYPETVFYWVAYLLFDELSQLKCTLVSTSHLCGPLFDEMPQLFAYLFYFVLVGRLFCTVGVHPTRCRVLILVLSGWLLSLSSVESLFFFYLWCSCLLLISSCCVGVWRERWSGRSLSSADVTSQGGSSEGKGISVLASDSDMLFYSANKVMLLCMEMDSYYIGWISEIFYPAWLFAGHSWNF